MWIPVDPTEAEIVDFLTNVSNEDKRISTPFLRQPGPLQLQRSQGRRPPAHGRALLPMAIQFPAALCDTMEQISGAVILEHRKLDATVM